MFGYELEILMYSSLRREILNRVTVFGSGLWEQLVCAASRLKPALSARRRLKLFTRRTSEVRCQRRAATSASPGQARRDTGPSETGAFPPVLLGLP